MPSPRTVGELIEELSKPLYPKDAPIRVEMLEAEGEKVTWWFPIQECWLWEGDANGFDGVVEVMNEPPKPEDDLVVIRIQKGTGGGIRF